LPTVKARNKPKASAIGGETYGVRQAKMKRKKTIFRRSISR
jgi:hypothetical protein